LTASFNAVVTRAAVIRPGDMDGVLDLEQGLRDLRVLVIDRIALARYGRRPAPPAAPRFMKAGTEAPEPERAKARARARADFLSDPAVQRAVSGAARPRRLPALPSRAHPQ
jgi:hypothetical protein